MRHPRGALGVPGNTVCTKQEARRAEHAGFENCQDRQICCLRLPSGVDRITSEALKGHTLTSLGVLEARPGLFRELSLLTIPARQEEKDMATEIRSDAGPAAEEACQGGVRLPAFCDTQLSVEAAEQLLALDRDVKHKVHKGADLPSAFESGDPPQVQARLTFSSPLVFPQTPSAT